jgi:ubiquitin-conjugating enzyme E2 G1
VTPPHPQASLLLRKQLAELNKNPVEGFSAGLIDDDDIYRWEVGFYSPTSCSPTTSLSSRC